MMEQIQKMYAKQKRGRLNAIVVFLITYFLMIGIISLFLGSPFPHKEIFVFIEMMQSGWLSTHGYLLLLCAAVGVIAGIASLLYTIMNGFKKPDAILSHQCDTKQYLAFMERAVSYGKGIHLNKLQKVVFSLSQQKYVFALLADWRLEEAKQYLQDEWIGNKDSQAYRKLTTNHTLIALYQSHNAEKFCEALQDAGKGFQQNRVFVAEKLILQEQYSKAAELLSAHQEKTPYNEVSRNYLLGVCYDKLGAQKQAEECMRYVEARGNTMPCKEQAQAWLKANVKDAFKQGGNSSDDKS